MVMEVSDVLKLVDSWYKALMVGGGGVFIGTLFFPVHGIKPETALLLSGGAFLLGLGEWKNHKEVSWIKEANAYTGGPAFMRATVRQPDLVGVLFEVVGIVLLGVAVWRLIHY